MNQLTAIAGGGPMRFSGNLSETGRVTIAGSPATMSAKTNFSGWANTVVGTNVVALVATDASANTTNVNYQFVVTNNTVARVFTHDLVGNLTSNATLYSSNVYEWDGANRLVKITQSLTNAPQRVTEFTYDGLGRRIGQTEKTNGVVESTITFLWCRTKLCEERDSDGDTVAKRFFGQGEQIGGTNYFFFRDHLGSVREMTDAAQAIVARYDYDPYGRRTKVQGSLLERSGRLCQSGLKSSL